jgi:hypothetical protein
MRTNANKQIQSAALDCALSTQPVSIQASVKYALVTPSVTSALFCIKPELCVLQVELTCFLSFTVNAHRLPTKQ